jgi:very-short-patch-repair endonuclease
VKGLATASNVNREEALTIASLIAAATEQREYDTATFGVISLVGDEQALEVDRLLRTYLPPVEYEGRSVLCGNAAQFQGDERDVMFLSVVDSPSGRPLPRRTEDRFKKRFNVAASRARDQMWVVYSLDLAADLQPDDLRRRLIQHALDPGDLMRRLAAVAQRVDSEFERQVAQRLIAKGFHVEPQWQVGYYRIDLVVVGGEDRLAVECDGDRYHGLDQLPHDMERQAILERCGWKFVRVRGSEYFRDPDTAMRPVFKRLDELGIAPQNITVDAVDFDGDALRDRVIRRAAEIRREWDHNPHGPWPMQPTEQHPGGPKGRRSVTGQITQPNESDATSQEPPKTVDASDAEGLPRHDDTSAAAAQRKPISSKKETRAGSSPPKSFSPNRPMPLFDGGDPIEPHSGEPVDLKKFFDAHGIPSKDRRPAGGSFWVTGGLELSGLMEELKRQGMHFRFTEKGGKATGHRPGWYL